MGVTRVREKVPTGDAENMAARQGPRDRLSARLTAEAEILDDLLVNGLILALEVIKLAAACVYLADQPVTGAVILLVGFQVLGQHLDLFGENGDLDFARTGVALVALELLPNSCSIDLAHKYALRSLLRVVLFSVNFPAHTIENIPAACKAQIRPEKARSPAAGSVSLDAPQETSSLSERVR